MALHVSLVVASAGIAVEAWEGGQAFVLQFLYLPVDSLVDDLHHQRPLDSLVPASLPFWLLFSYLCPFPLSSHGFSDRPLTFSSFGMITKEPITLVCSSVIGHCSADSVLYLGVRVRGRAAA